MAKDESALDKDSGQEAATGGHGPGHHYHGEDVVWERWQKNRVFVRALEGTYG